ncbi:MAG: sel1 repeat family protein [Parachlamydiaceae bacterium]|nr:sel1 repeat family protein [Parachlamydiaceae bacterium]
MKYYNLSADQEYGPALIKLADYCDSDEVKDYKKACDYYKKAADQGYAEAQCDLGFHYKYGDGVDIDLSIAIHYYQLAAEQNDCRALCNLAVCYEEGAGVTQSSKEAFKYFKKAADLGFARGQFRVARCYSLGLGVKESFEKAIEYFELALGQDYKTEEILEKIQECKNAQRTGEKSINKLNKSSKVILRLQGVSTN